MSTRTRSCVLAALLCVLAPAAGCGDAKSSVVSSLESVSSDPTSCREEHPEGVIAFAVGPDGSVRAGATGADGKPTKIDGGTLTFRKEGAAATEARLTPEGDGTVAAAKGPPLEATVTAMDYAVDVGGKTLTGVLHLPAGGTKTLAEEGEATAAEEAPGPNGGQVQIVAGEPIEVAVAPSGDVAAYVLDADRKPVITTGRTIWVLVDGEKVALTQREDGMFFGRTTVLAPRKVSLVVVRDSKIHFVLVGHKRGKKFIASRAPGIVVVKEISRGKGPIDKNLDEPGMGHAKGKEKHDEKDKKEKKEKKDKVDGPDRNHGSGNDKDKHKGKGKKDK